MYLDRRVGQPKRSIPRVIVTIPSSDLDILDSLEINNNAEVMGRSWGEVHEMLYDLVRNRDGHSNTSSFILGENCHQNQREN